ncbi:MULTISPECIES: hypothetical protein [unclassified Bradyrhizobium]|uniref:hypothetical protein n=1 Tax=unclassified Bradyrhizobium TaxID=2631580 RepID=UPI00211F2546|nr:MULTISPECIES: hypothetical protein [unclassified Bradyrhizobium]MDD1534158.1 hypothetical protein [Bradyrhizobium sp. WBOS8]MDD1583879.1 hypothetical protein [Bradyrhizobium sp. WBOS4]UUO46871.1 hypothetical protein DCM78_08020 [Bradyrhizobium sp. WBOS04]UUO60490.1 hypothetical protein DCM80_15765 [Bradyrhizobium sp. WBOS08]
MSLAATIVGKRKLQSDAEILVEALDEAKRLLASAGAAGPPCRSEQHEVLNMIEFIVYDPAVARAVERLKLRARLKAVA